MALIRITSHRQPWIGDLPREFGEEIEVSNEDATTMVEGGFAEIITPRRRRAASDNEAE